MNNQLQNFYLDKHVNKHVEKYVTPYFKNIHPNTITISGIFLNGFALYSYFIMKNKHLTAILLLCRILTDNLDGMVARKFNKVSKIGGLLDSIADSILMASLWYGFLKYFKTGYEICISLNIACFMICYLIYYDAIFIHTNLISSDNVVTLLIYENTYLTILFVIVLMYMG